MKKIFLFSMLAAAVISYVSKFVYPRDYGDGAFTEGISFGYGWPIRWFNYASDINGAYEISYVALVANFIILTLAFVLILTAASSLRKHPKNVEK